MGDIAVEAAYSPFLPLPPPDEVCLAAAGTGFLFSNPVQELPDTPLVVRDSVMIISNPRAGSGKANHVKGRLIAVMEQMEGEGRLLFEGQDTLYLKTHADPVTRVAAVLHVIKKSDPQSPPTIVVIGGDGTFADVAKAVYEASEQGFRAKLVPGPGGTAGDMRIELGVPRNPKLMPRFLATAHEAELSVITASFDGGPERIVVHSQGNGISGAIFAEVEKVRVAGGKVSVATYARALIKGIPSLEPFFVKINGGAPLPVGEVLALANSTSIGSVVRVPLPPEGGALLAIPVVPDVPGPMRPIPGIGPALDVFRRGLLYMLGDQTVIAPGNKVGLLSPQRVFPIAAGEKLLLEFVDADGNPKPVPGLINGDSTRPASSVLLEGKQTTIATLAAPDSALMVRRGLARPRTMRAAVLGGFADCAGHFGTPAALALMAAWELRRETMTPEDERAADSSMMVGLAAADAFSVWSVGTISFFAEFPLIAGPFGAGYELASAGSEFAAKRFKIDFMERERAGNRMAGIAGGWAATWGAIKLVGSEAWKASASQINSFLVRYVGGAGDAVGAFFVNAARYSSFLRPMLPVVILPSAAGALPAEPGDPRGIPTL